MKKSGIMKGLAAFAAVATLTLSSGCTIALLGLGVGAGVAGTAYYEGKLTSTLEAKPDKIQAATELAFKELNIKQMSSISDALNAKVVGQTAAEKEVTVTAELQKDGKSKLGIRVGTFGDKELSEKIHDLIKKKLIDEKK